MSSFGQFGSIISGRSTEIRDQIHNPLIIEHSTCLHWKLKEPAVGYWANPGLVIETIRRLSCLGLDSDITELRGISSLQHDITYPLVDLMRVTELSHHIPKIFQIPDEEQKLSFHKMISGVNWRMTLGNKVSKLSATSARHSTSLIVHIAITRTPISILSRLTYHEQNTKPKSEQIWLIVVDSWLHYCYAIVWLLDILPPFDSVMNHNCSAVLLIKNVRISR